MKRLVWMILLAAGGLSTQLLAQQQARDLSLTSGKSVIVDSPVNIERVSVANPLLAEVVMVSPRQVLINGKAAGDTSLIVWQQGGQRLIFDLNVQRSKRREDAVLAELHESLPGQDVRLNAQDGTVYLKGVVNDLTSADRAVEIAAPLGKVVNLLRVKVPPIEPEVLLKVRFLDVDRSASTELALNVISTGAGNTIGRVTTGQYSPPGPQNIGNGAQFTLSDALNIFLFRPDLNLGATIKALVSKNLAEILAEPNVLAINGKPASFLAGGEFPFPTLQGGGAGLGAVTIQFREFGVRINFLPTLTPRGTLRLEVTPEVSSLDYSNALTFQGFTIPALATRRVSTVVELEPGQTFAIGGLLDNRVTETFTKVPGLGDIPFFGKLFQSRNRSKNHTELLVMVTPEIVRPMPAGSKLPELEIPIPPMKGGTATPPRTPGQSATGPVPVKPPRRPFPSKS